MPILPFKSPCTGVPYGALQGLKLLLAPVLLAQGVRVRQRALVLPEAPGPRVGYLGHAGDERPPLRLLIVGDSSAAGVGAPHQDQALAATVAGQVQRVLQRSVQWQLVAQTGWTSACAVAALADHELGQADVWVSVLGVNDVVRQVAPGHTLRNLLALHAAVQARTGALQWVHCAVPPLHRFPLLPAPLRWVLGAQAALLNRRLVAALADRADTQVLGLPPGLGAVGELMAEDGFHPGPAGYAVWGAHVAQHVAQLWAKPRARRQSASEGLK